MANSDLDLEHAQRIASLEVKSFMHDESIKSHAQHLKSLDKAVTELIVELRGMRRAMYLMAGAVAANVPALAGLFAWIKQVF